MSVSSRFRPTTYGPQARSDQLGITVNTAALTPGQYLALCKKRFPDGCFGYMLGTNGLKCRVSGVKDQWSFKMKLRMCRKCRNVHLEYNPQDKISTFQSKYLIFYLFYRKEI
jgi:hypothetical protein